MRAIRTAFWPGPNQDPTILVVRASDVKQGLELTEVAQPLPGALVTSDIFEVPDDATIEDATRLASTRYRKRDSIERALALGFYWFASVLPRTTPGGVIQTTIPAPFPAEDAEIMLSQLALHPDYDRHTVNQFTNDGAVASLQNGVVRIISAPV